MTLLTQAQKQALRAHIEASQDLATHLSNSDYSAIADALNAASNPAFVVWRTSVPVEEYRDALVFTEVDQLTVGKSRIWEWITGNMTLPLETGKSAVRQGLADCWASNSATRPALIALAKRTATRAEGVLATGTGSDAAPGGLAWEGEISVFDVGPILEA